MVGGADTVWRHKLRAEWDTMYSSDQIEVCDSLDAEFAVNYNCFLSPAYFDTAFFSNPTLSEKWSFWDPETTGYPLYPDTAAIFADLDSLLDYIYGSESGISKFDSARWHDGGDSSGFDVSIIWVIGDDMPESAP
ncbi:MAG: hypothetical protein ACP5G4_11635, partial [bacterium]